MKSSLIKSSRTLWHDCDGGVITTELVLVASFVTAIVLGGLSVLKTKISGEFEQLGNVVEAQRLNSESPSSSKPAPEPAASGVEFFGEFDPSDDT